MTRRSRRTIAEEFTAELAGAGVFQLFARRLGPNQPVFVAATGFDATGELRRVSGLAPTLASGIDQVLAAIDRDDQASPPASEPHAPRKRRRPTRAPAPAPAPEVIARPTSGPERLRKVALARVARVGAITAGTLVEAAGLTPSFSAEDAAAQVLRELERAGELRRSHRYGYVARQSTLEPTTPEEP